MSTLQQVIARDTTANRPAAGIPGRLFFATDTSKMWRDNGTSWDDVTSTGGSQPVMIPCYIPGKPDAGAVLFDITPNVAMTIPAGLTGSTLRITTANPTATATYSFLRNGVEFGTLAIATSGTPTWTAASDVSFNGTTDYLQIVAPASQDATLSGVGICLKGTR